MKSLFKTLSTAFLALTLAVGLGVNYANAQDNTVMEVVDSNEELGTFSELLAETQLPDLLNQGGPFTVIAPTDDAFENSDINVEELKENPKQLQNLVVGHLFRGTLSSDQVEPNTGVSVQDGDVSASNGVVHLVEDVIQQQQQGQQQQGQ